MNGQSALLLDLPLPNAWANLRRSPANEMDMDLLNSVMLRHDAGVHVLAFPHRPEDAEGISGEYVQRAIEHAGKWLWHLFP